MGGNHINTSATFLESLRGAAFAKIGMMFAGHDDLHHIMKDLSAFAQAASEAYKVEFDAFNVDQLASASAPSSALVFPSVLLEMSPRFFEIVNRSFYELIYAKSEGQITQIV